MKITKYPQSCFLIETQKKRILIDPGNLKFEEKWIDEDWKDVDAILVTHKHSDHCYIEVINKITNRDNTKVYTTKEVVDFYPDLENIQIVKQADILDFDGIKVEVVKAVHGYHPLLKNRKEVYENVGYIIDDGQNKVYHVGDSICFNNDYCCDVILLPISNHGVVMGPWEASYYAKEYNPKLVIPMHADSHKHPVINSEVERELKDRSLNYQFIKISESVEI